MYYSFIHLPLPFNCQFHSQLEKSTIFLTLQIISHFSSPLVLSRKYQQHLPASIHNLIHIPSNHYARRSPRSFLFFRDNLPASLHPPPPSKIEQNNRNPHRKAGTWSWERRIRSCRNFRSSPVLRRIEHLRASFRRHWIMAAIYCRIIYCENQPAPDNQLPRQSRHWRNVNHIKNPVTSLGPSLRGSTHFSFFSPLFLYNRVPYSKLCVSTWVFHFVQLLEQINCNLENFIEFQLY